MKCLAFDVCGKKKEQSRSRDMRSGAVFVPFYSVVQCFQGSPEVEAIQVENACLLLEGVWVCVQEKAVTQGFTGPWEVWCVYNCPCCQSYQGKSFGRSRPGGPRSPRSQLLAVPLTPCPGQGMSYRSFPKSQPAHPKTGPQQLVSAALCKSTCIIIES